jgi:peptidoglycan/LPS O-acetylase OafA/YrhL/lysophospholipase L1-like esterase
VTATDVAGAREDERYATRRHQPALDGLRGLAVAGVLLFHGGHLTGGYLGVDAFFVLSGFLITSLLLAELSSTSRISLSRFWARRARRLLPALGCVLAAVALYAVLLAHDNELSAIRGDALATIAYVANWRQIFISNDYWALFRSPSPLQHTWSLSIEEQFYVLWPLVVVAVTRGRSATDAARRVLATACAGTAVSFVLMQLTFDAADTSRAYYGTDTRMSSILIGAALAAWLALRGPVATAKRKHLEAAAIAGAMVLALAWSHLSGTSTALYRGGFFVCAVATMLLIAAGVHPDRGPVSRALSWRPLRELGLISYGVYLWHWPVYVVVDANRAHVTGWPLLALRVIVTLIVSVVSFRLVERRIRYGAHSARSMIRIAPALTVVLVLAVIASTTGAVSTAGGSTKTQHGGVLLVGDSVAHSLFPGLQRAGLPVTEAWSPGCRLLTGKLTFTTRYSTNCPWHRFWSAAVRDQRPDVVVLLIGAWDLFDLKPPGFDRFLTPGSREWDDYYTAQLERAITLLGSHGAHVVIPSLPCQGTLSGTPRFDERSSANVDRVRAANAILAKVVARHADRVSSPDLFSALCPAGHFQNGVGDIAIARTDGVHYSEEGAAFVTSLLAPTITKYLPGAAPPGEPVSAADRVVTMYGDTLLLESKQTIVDALPLSSGWQVSVHAGALAAVCDMTESLRHDLALYHPGLVVLETHGGDSTACMRDALGRQIVRGSPEYWARYRDDLSTFFDAVRAGGARLLVFTTPPDAFQSSKVEQQRRGDLLREIARRYPNATVSDAGRQALGGSTFAAELPCLPDELGTKSCKDNRAVVRAPDRVNFCPDGYATIAAIGAGCPSYSSGAVRYGRAIVSEMVSVLSRR